MAPGERVLAEDGGGEIELPAAFMEFIEEHSGKGNGPVFLEQAQGHSRSGEEDASLIRRAIIEANAVADLLAKRRAELRGNEGGERATSDAARFYDKDRPVQGICHPHRKVGGLPRASRCGDDQGTSGLESREEGLPDFVDGKGLHVVVE